MSLASTGTVTNSGSISGVDGLVLRAGGQVVNNSGAVDHERRRAREGVRARAPGCTSPALPARVTNNGVINGVAYGVALG